MIIPARPVGPRMVAAALMALLGSASGVVAQAIGPDIISSGSQNALRYGTDTSGTTTAYSVGAVTCNRGDLPAAVSTTTDIRVRIAQNMYRLKTVPGTAYQRFEQVGQSWAKRVASPGNGQVNSCGTCTNVPYGYLGVACADIYTAQANGYQGVLGPRSMCNATLGTSGGGEGTSVGDATTRGRIQVPTADVANQPAGTRFFVETVLLLPDDAQYVRPGQSVAINGLNNAASQEVNINGGSSDPTLLGGLNRQVPALQWWADADPGVVLVTADHDDTPNPNPAFPGTFIRARYFAAVRVTRLDSGHWRYEYVVYNLNSDRAAGSFEVPLPAAASITDYTFHHPLAHSGEPYSNAPWGLIRTGTGVSFFTDSYVVNADANAIRWGTMYNFGFTSTAAPGPGEAILGLFQPGAVDQVTFIGLSVPTVAPCSGDFDGDGQVATDADIEAFFACVSGDCCPTCDPHGADFNSDGAVATDADIEAFFRVLAGGNC
jgi:hypothetical protein